MKTAIRRATWNELQELKKLDWEKYEYTGEKIQLISDQDVLEAMRNGETIQRYSIPENTWDILQYRLPKRIRVHWN